MEEEEDIPLVLRDDCEDGRDGLTAQDVLRDEVQNMLQELKEYFERDSEEIELPVKVEIKEEEEEYIEFPEMEIKLEDGEDEPQPSTSRPSPPRSRKRPEVKQSQILVAEEMLKMIRRSQPHIGLEKFQYFDMSIITPSFICLGCRSVSREQLHSRHFRKTNGGQVPVLYQSEALQ